MRQRLRFSIPAVLTAAALLLAAPGARAQQPPPNNNNNNQNNNNNGQPGFQVNPNLALQQAAFMAAALGQQLQGNNPGGNPLIQPGGMGAGAPNVNPWGAMTSTPYNSTISSMPYNPYYNSGYGYPALTAGYGNSYSASLFGLASLTQAQGQYLNDWQKARMTNQQVEQAKLETRKQMLQLWQLERASIPSLEDIRTRDMEMQLKRARRDPPLTEVVSGDSLNALLKSSQTFQDKKVVGPHIDLDADVLKNITLTGGNGGNIGLLKNEGKLNWTTTLRDTAFDKDRDALAVLAADAVKNAEFNNSVAPATLTQMRKHLDNMGRTLEANINTIPTGKYMEAARYLGKLEDAITALGSDNVANFFTQKWSAKGKTVGELVDYMHKNGLRFASAAPGEEAAYQALHRALVRYEQGQAQNGTVSSKP